MAGTFDGKPDLVTVNSGSNSLTVISDVNSAHPQTFTISSGGTDPVSAFAFNNGNGFDDLVVANNGDGAFALFEGSAEGLTLVSTEFNSNLPNPTALAFEGVIGDQIDFYAATEGREDAILVALALGGAGSIPGSTGAPIPSPLPANEIAQLVAIDDSSLALVGSLLIVTIDTSESEAGEVPSAIEGSAETPAAGGPGQSSGSVLSNDGTDEDDSADSNGEGKPPAVPLARDAMTWERFVLGTDEALERYSRDHQETPTVRPDERPSSNVIEAPDDDDNRDRDDAAPAESSIVPGDIGSSTSAQTRTQIIDEAIDHFYAPDAWPTTAHAADGRELPEPGGRAAPGPRTRFDRCRAHPARRWDRLKWSSSRSWLVGRLPAWSSAYRIEVPRERATALASRGHLREVALARRDAGFAVVRDPPETREDLFPAGTSC